MGGLSSNFYGAGLWSQLDNQVPCLLCHMFKDQKNSRSRSMYESVTKTMSLTRFWTKQHMMPTYRQLGSL